MYVTIWNKRSVAHSFIGTFHYRNRFHNALRLFVYISYHDEFQWTFYCRIGLKFLYRQKQIGKLIIPSFLRMKLLTYYLCFRWISNLWKMWSVLTWNLQKRRLRRQKRSLSRWCWTLRILTTFRPLKGTRTYRPKQFRFTDVSIENFLFLIIISEFLYI